MAIELIATVCFGLVAAGIVLAVLKLLRFRAAGVAAIACAGAAMIAFTAWNRYHWAERIEASLPENVHVVREIRGRGILDPWSYVMPLTSGLVALDHGRTLRHSDHPDSAIVTLLQIEPYSNVVTLTLLVDCKARRFAPLDDGASFREGALPRVASWTTAEGDTAFLTNAVCEGRKEPRTRLSTNP